MEKNINKSEKKMRTKELIFAGAFAAIYIVVMLIIVMSTGMVPVLYIAAPIPVGMVCGTIYLLSVLKARRFGAALIMGVLFALVACNGAVYCLVSAIVFALLAELIIFLGKYKSKKMYLLSFVVFNLNMSCPYMIMWLNYEGFMKRANDYYGEAYASGLGAVTPSWIWYLIFVFAIIGGILGAVIGGKLVNKHFKKAGIV